MRMYELIPTNGRKSFYGKAQILVDETGETLFSYSAPILHIDKSGKMTRLWDGWSATTGTHIKSFCGLNKAQFEKIPMNMRTTEA